jgi:hypothetical protein
LRTRQKLDSEKIQVYPETSTENTIKEFHLRKAVDDCVEMKETPAGKSVATGRPGIAAAGGASLPGSIAAAGGAKGKKQQQDIRHFFASPPGPRTGQGEKQNCKQCCGSGAFLTPESSIRDPGWAIKQDPDPG